MTPSAISRLISSYENFMYWSACRVIANPDDRKDCMQQCRIKLAQILPDLKVLNMDGYIRQTIVNESNQWARLNRPKLVLVCLDEAKGVHEIERTVSPWIEVYNALSPDEKAVILAAAFCESGKEAAASLGIAYSTYRHRLFRVRATCRILAVGVAG